MPKINLSTTYAGSQTLYFKSKPSGLTRWKAIYNAALHTITVENTRTRIRATFEVSIPGAMTIEQVNIESAWCVDAFRRRYESQ